MDDLAGRIRETSKNSCFEKIEVIFAPLHFDDYVIKGNKLIINFFRVKPENGTAFVVDQELTGFIEEKLEELVNR